MPRPKNDRVPKPWCDSRYRCYKCKGGIGRGGRGFKHAKNVPCKDPVEHLHTTPQRGTPSSRHEPPRVARRRELIQAAATAASAAPLPPRPLRHDTGHKGLMPGVTQSPTGHNARNGPGMPDYRRALCPVRRGVITGIRPYARYHVRNNQFAAKCNHSHKARTHSNQSILGSIRRSSRGPEDGGSARQRPVIDKVREEARGWQWSRDGAG